MATDPLLSPHADRPRAAARLALAVLAVALGITVAGWHKADTRAEEAARARFSSRATEVQETVTGRMHAYEQLLRAGAALFRTGREVTRQDWHDFVTGLQVQENYVGIDVVGFARHVVRSDLAAYAARMHADAGGSYDIWPPGDRREYLPVEYRVPDTRDRRHVLGFDLMSEPVRRAALEWARDTGLPAVTRKMQMANVPGMAGFLMVVPVYARGAATGTVEARRAALIGFVYSPFRAQEFVRTILGPLLSEVHVELFDGSEAVPEKLLFSGGVALKSGASGAAPVGEDRHITINGSPWTIRVRPGPASPQDRDSGLPVTILTGGLMVSLLLFAMTWLLATRHARALALAQRMTAEWRKQEVGLVKSQQTLARLNNALDHTVDIILMMEPDSLSFVYFNAQAVRAYGYSADELGTMTLRDLNPRLNEKAMQAMRCGESNVREVEVIHRRKDASEFPVEVRMQWFQEGPGTGLFVSVIRDITRRRESERLKREFVSTVSHELRTPLTSVYGSLSLIALRMAGELPPRVRSLIEMAHQNSERLTQIVDDFLDIEKTETGAMTFRLEVVSPEQIIEKAVSLNRAYAEKYSVSFNMQQPLPDVEVRADSDRLVQVLTNLMSNAAKFSPTGGMVEIRASRAGDVVRFEVHDQGPGVPEEFHGRIFEKFAQADASNTKRHNGSGLGLSICKLMIEKMGGRIGFSSEPGQGATFYFELPIWSEPTRVKELPAHDAAPRVDQS